MERSQNGRLDETTSLGALAATTGDQVRVHSVDGDVEVDPRADLSVLGFTSKELAVALTCHSPGLTDENAVPEVAASAVCRPGDIWCMGQHRLGCGDSTDPAVVAAVLAGLNPNLMATDPPYGVGYDPAWRHRAGVNRSARLGKVLNDERADPFKQTKVAATYLHDLYTIFGDWALVMAAYNSGEPRVMGAIVKNGRANFWDLYEKELLPKETRDYVPKILAAIRVASQQDSYGPAPQAILDAASGS